MSLPWRRVRAGAVWVPGNAGLYLGRAQQQLVEVLEPGLDAVQDAAVDSVRPLESLSVRVHQAFHSEGTPGFTRDSLTAPSSRSEQSSDTRWSSWSLPPQPILGFWDFMTSNHCPTQCLISNSTKTILLLHFSLSIFSWGPELPPVPRGGDFIKEPPVTLAMLVVFSSKIRMKNNNFQLLNIFVYLHYINNID